MSTPRDIVIDIFDDISPDIVIDIPDDLEESAEDNSLGSLGILPPELMLMIFSYVDDADFKTIAQLSHRFNEIMHEEVFDSFFGHSLKFMRWESEQIAEFSTVVKEIIHNLKVTLLNRPHETMLQSFTFWFQFELMFTCIVAMAWNAQQSLYREINEVLATSGCCALAFGIMAAYFRFTLRCDNQRYLAQPISTMHAEGLRVLQAELPFLQHNPAVTATTNRNLIQSLQTLLKDTKNYLCRLDDYLCKQNRFRAKSFDEQDVKALNAIQPQLGIYAKNMLTFWQNSQEEKDASEVTRTAHFAKLKKE
jgi:hypothetical protein